MDAQLTPNPEIMSSLIPFYSGIQPKYYLITDDPSKMRLNLHERVYPFFPCFDHEILCVTTKGVGSNWVKIQSFEMTLYKQKTSLREFNKEIPQLLKVSGDTIVNPYQIKAVRKNCNHISLGVTEPTFEIEVSEKFRSDIRKWMKHDQL